MVEIKEKVFNDLRKKNVRITNQRRTIIDILDGQHLTIQEIHGEMKRRGYQNLGTIYNNVDFLTEHKIVTQIFINGKKHYDLTIDEQSHSADSHIHVTCKANNNIIEINDIAIFDDIKKQGIFKEFDIGKLQIVVEGVCKYYESAQCKKDGSCFIRNLYKNGNR